MDHRVMNRKPLLMNVQVSSPQLGLVLGQTADLTMSGMFIQTQSTPVPLHERVTISFQPDPDNLTITCRTKAVVVRHDETGFGVRFLSLPPDCEQALRGMVAVKQSGHPVASVEHQALF